MDAKRLEKYRQRLYSQTPLIAKRRWRKAAQALVQDGSPTAVQVLAKAVARHDDARAQQVMVEALRQLVDQRCIAAVCAVWAATRHAGLSALLAERGWAASAPAKVKVLSALLVGQWEGVTTGERDVVEPLVQACEDADPTIAARARQALHNLQHREAQETLCRIVLDSDHTTAREVAIAAQYAPQEFQQRALFYFLTEQWDKYESLDFDQTLLRAVYEVGDARLRQRVAETARRVGRVEWIEVVTGGRQRRRLGEMTDGEWETTLAMLTAQKQGEVMWRLAQIALAVWSVRLLHQLADMAWMPQAEQERTGFVEIRRLAARLAGKIPELYRFIYSLVPLGEHTLTWAMSPDGRVLASGSKNKTVELWSVPDGKYLRTLTGHTDSVDCLAMSPDGRVLASGSGDGMVRLWSMPDGEELRTLTGHPDRVYHLAMSPDGRVLASGSSGTVWLWSVPDGQALCTLTEPGGWGLAMSSDGRVLASRSRDGTVRLWSLESLRLSYLPLGHTSVEVMVWVQHTLQSGEASEAERAWLEFLLAMMHWRRRFDIGVGEAPRRLEVGEFDIEIEG